MITSTSLFEGVNEDFEQIESKTRISKQQLWHEHLGHPGRDTTRAITNLLKDKNMAELDLDMTQTCEQCIQSKSTIAQMGQGSCEKSISPLDLIHINLIVDSSHAAEYTCTLVLVDDHSKYTYVQLLLWKSHAFSKLQAIVSYLETQTGKRLKVIQSDQGMEW